ncbi:hypothetical protein Pelo_19742 [Pelomyxa schiedti]|nr:hypothetical protein Pelo_19742 [Pelomyxa schiedti]
MHRTPAALWDSLERWPVLEPCEKLKLVMSWLELNNINTTTTPGSVDSAKITKGINSVLDLGVCDEDEWVCVMSQIVRELCSTNHSSAIQNPIMLDTLKSLEELCNYILYPMLMKHDIQCSLNLLLAHPEKQQNK